MSNLIFWVLDGLATDLVQHYDRSSQPTELGGKSGTEWKTARAKVYPYKLCKVLAMAHLRHARTLRCEGEELVPEGVQAAIDALPFVHDPYDENAQGVQMCSDFQIRPMQ